MKILVTGAAGFIGSALSIRLLELGHDVIGIDSYSDYYARELKLENVARIPSDRFTLIEADLNAVNLDEILAGGIEVIYHQAGQPGVRKSWGQDFETYVNANVLATQKLLEATKGAPSVRRMVYASSSSVYGNAEVYPTHEALRPEPMSPYGVTKLAAEHLCSLYARNFGVPTTSLRYFTVYGPGQRPDMAFTRFTKAAASGDEITLFGSGDQIRDFTFISDIVEANIAAGTADTVPGTVLNVAGGGSISINDALDIIADVSGNSLRITRTPSVDGDVFRTGGNIDKIGEELGWKPKVAIEEGLRRHYEWATEVRTKVSND